ncbi:hypothetical protein [Pararhizobium sp. PWRC1-1]|uniref:hypothetical protein n=1 Tax=Pararhizobium sp. PWRC1-1 TaxID=2804566 RepID=UPI003CEB10D9
MELLLIVGLTSVVCGGGCAIIASNKKRDPLGWFVLGFLFNLVALIVIAVLTPADESARDSRRNNLGSDEPHDKEELRKKAAELASSLAQSKAKLAG